jgi:hypothetical protein
VEDLAHRRRLAAARQSREIERASLLQKLIETQQKALELRKWITQWETKEQASSPEVQRLIKWEGNPIRLREFPFAHGAHKAA